MATPRQFLEKHGFDIDSFNREELLSSFLNEMEAGLKGEKSSLMMIPSFINTERPIPTEKPVIILDAGGTNLRAATVCIKKDGTPVISDYVKRPMPGTKEEISDTDFFDTLADLVAPIADRSDTVGFCFSYPAEILPDCDARLIRWSKQIQAPSVVGKLLGTGLKNSLLKRGINKRVVILNDTVTTLLAGKCMGIAKGYSAYVGFILGTGTNTSYAEKNINILKRNDLDPDAGMAINIESGAFRGLKRSDFDVMLDRETDDPGTFFLEKMIAGAYLGKIGKFILKTAATEGLFSEKSTQVINAIAELENKDLDDFCAGCPGEGNPLNAIAVEDAKTVCELCAPVYERSAVLSAVNIAAAIIKTGCGQDAAHPVCVNADGSTFYLTRTGNFRGTVIKELDALLTPRGIHYEIIKVDDSPIIGSAVAGLV